MRSGSKFSVGPRTCFSNYTCAVLVVLCQSVRVAVFSFFLVQRWQLFMARHWLTWRHLLLWCERVTRQSHLSTVLSSVTERPTSLKRHCHLDPKPLLLIMRERRALGNPETKCLLVGFREEQSKASVIGAYSRENQWEDTLFQGSPVLLPPSSVKRRAVGSRLELEVGEVQRIWWPLPRMQTFKHSAHK